MDAILLLRVGLALALAVFVGWERERLARPAGLRTHMLVAASAAAFSGIALLLVDLVDASNARLDPIRAIEAIVAGIGFVGAGTVFISKDRVVGLTTAASLLATAALGTAAGLGRYLLAVGLTVLILIVLAVLRRMTPEPTEQPPPADAL